MTTSQKIPSLWLKRGGLNLLVPLIMAGLIGILFFFEFKPPAAEADLAFENLENLATVQGNSLLPISDPSGPELQPVQRIRVVVTGYSSSIWETDDTPNITAAGTWVRDGIIANNYLSIGTKVRLPELFGDKVFVVEDRMSWTKGNYHIDIWFPSYWEALNFGAKRTYIEILEG